MMKLRIFSFLLLLILISKTLKSQNYTCLLKEIKVKKSPITSVAYLNEDTLYTGHSSKEIIIWNLKEGKKLSSFQGHYDDVRAIAVSPNKKYILTGGDKIIKVWKTNGEYINKWTGSSTSIWTICFNKKGDKVASGSFNKSFLMRNSLTGEILNDFEGHSKSVLGVAFSNNGKYIASGSLDKIVKIWSLENNNLLKNLKGHGHTIYSLDFSSNDKTLATASLDKTVKIWNMETMSHTNTLIGHDKGVVKAKFLLNNNYILTASFDMTLRLWNIKDGKEIFVFLGHEGPINDFVILPNEKRFISVSSDETIKIWEISPKIFVDYYYKKELNKEISESNLFKPKKKGETRSDYKKRQEKADHFMETLYKKYYEKFKIETQDK